MENTTKDKCRNCGEKISVYKNQSAKVDHSKEDAKWNQYGGWVCSRSCDYNACVTMESSFPGAGVTKTPGQSSMRKIKENWGE